MSKRYATATAAEEAFYTAFSNLDIILMQQVWVSMSAAYCIHPSGQLFRGKQAILSSWDNLFQSAERPRIQHTLISEDRQSDQAVHLVAERIGPTVVAEESTAVVLATNIYLLTERGWRMFAHHATQFRSESASLSDHKQLH